MVWVNARRYNERKVLAEKRQKELFQRLDVLHTLELENASLVSFERNETPDAMKISELQEKIQAINKKCGPAKNGGNNQLMALICHSTWPFI